MLGKLDARLKFDPALAEARRVFFGDRDQPAADAAPLMIRRDGELAEIEMVVPVGEEYAADKAIAGKHDKRGLPGAFLLKRLLGQPERGGWRVDHPVHVGKGIVDEAK